MGFLRVKTTQQQSPLERAKLRNATATHWMMQFPWHNRIARAQVTFNDHIQRSAWRNCWAGMASLFCDTSVYSRWLATGRLRRFFQGHIATRWQTSVETCRLHAVDPWLILINRSSKFKDGFDLAVHEARDREIANAPECCRCSVRHTMRRPLYLCTSGLYACMVHRCFVQDEWHCVHYTAWKFQ